MQENNGNSNDSDELKNKVKDLKLREDSPAVINSDSQVDAKLGEARVSKKEAPTYEVDIRTLAAFVGADDLTKAKIVSETIYPGEFQRNYYTSAKSAIVNSIFTSNLLLLDQKVESLRIQTGGTSLSQTMRNCSIRALETYPKDKIPFKFRTLLNKQKVKRAKVYVDFMGLRINIKPNLIMRGEVEGVKTISAVKLHTNKSEPLDKKQMQFLSFFLYKYLEDISENDEYVNKELCLGIDVFNRSVQDARFEHSTLIQTLKSELNEFAEIWQQLK